MTKRLPDHLRVRLSKKMSGLLRHYGPKYGLRVSKDGWVRISDLVRVLRSLPGYDWVTSDDILEIVKYDDKGRYEIQGGMIRARYGHSLNVEVEYERIPWSKLPGTLYHGTVMVNLHSILKTGLKPMKRKYVHLSINPQDAYAVGKRHGDDVIVLEIDVECLKQKGLEVYRASERVLLVKQVPPECIRVTD